MTLSNPAWLLVAIPLAAALVVWRPAGRIQLVLRTISFALIVLALAGLAIRLDSRAGTLVVVTDRSRSMPADGDARAKEIIDLVSSKRPSDNDLGVVSFGRRTAVDLVPSKGGFGGFTGDVGQDASSLGEAVDEALSLMPAGSPARILVIGDGHWTGSDPAIAAVRAAERGIAIDYRMLARPAAGDIAIARIDAPQSVAKGEALLVSAAIVSPVPQEVAIELRRGATVVAAGRKSVPAGTSQITLRDRADVAGTLAYTLTVKGTGADPIPENNRARLLVGVRGTKPLLVVSQTGGLASLLARGGVDVDARTGQNADWSLESLSSHSAVVLEDLPASFLGKNGMETLAAWVKESGGGLLMTGGPSSFGAGGYFKSPIDPLLPVSMELRREHRKFALAIVVALDRSGSMAVGVGGGRTKMDLANQAAVQVLDMLSPIDEFGVVAVDSAPHQVADLLPVSDQGGVRGKILAIKSEGGGIYVYEALAYATRMLMGARAETRHVILFADAADAEEPGEYRELIEKARMANMTVSVVGLGTATDTDAELLRDVAKRGGGQVYFTSDPGELPRIFAQDTMIVARSTFVDTPSDVALTGGLMSIAGRSFTGAPAVGGYNLTYLKDGALLAGVTRDDQAAPLVASWQVGLGRAAVWTGEVDGKHTGAIASWPLYGDLLASLGRWAAGEESTLPPGMALTQELRGGVDRIELQLDPDAPPSLAELPELVVLRGEPGKAPRSEKRSLRWIDAGTLAADVPVEGSETVLSTLVFPNGSASSMTPVTLPYSPEFAPSSPEEGAATLARLAKITGGRERATPAEIWRDLPKKPRMIDLRSWLVLLAMLLLLLEILERRTGALSLVPGALRFRRGVAENVEAEAPEKKMAKAPRATAAVPVAAPPPVAAPESKPAPPASESSLGDALKKARQRAKDRTGG
ncbi:MAG: VWA domain-containing protein [Thermoanaerobaculia bacterium]